MATGATDGTIRLWPLDRPALAPGLDWTGVLAYLRSATSECLTVEQRVKVLGEEEPAAQQKVKECRESAVSREPKAK